MCVCAQRADTFMCVYVWKPGKNLKCSEFAPQSQPATSAGAGPRQQLPQDQVQENNH